MDVSYISYTISPIIGEKYSDFIRQLNMRLSRVRMLFLYAFVTIPF